jgi:large subunit ribosomal protein L29
MKAKDGVDKLRQMAAPELAAREKEAREQLFRLRFQLAAGQAESVKKLRELRKEMARLLTVRREKGGAS